MRRVVLGERVAVAADCGAEPVERDAVEPAAAPARRTRDIHLEGRELGEVFAVGAVLAVVFTMALLL